MVLDNNYDSPKEGCRGDKAMIRRDLDNIAKQYTQIIKMIDTTRQTDELARGSEKSPSWLQRLIRKLNL